MSTQVVPFAQAPVPAHIAKFVSEHSNIPERNVVNQLSFRGKVWRQVIDGEEKALVNKEDEPVSTVHVVVLNFNKSRSRSYYEGAYEEGKSKPPSCWSLDGEAPDPEVKEPQSSTCAKCQWSVKGSKITPNGKETTACSVYKRLAVVPVVDLQCPPMLLRLAQTSMWDKNNEDNESKGFYAWDQFTDFLRQRGAAHTGVVATKIKFDNRMAYPKLVFAASRWLTDEELAEVVPRFEEEAVLKLLNASEVAAAERKPSTDADDGGLPAPPKKVAPRKLADDDDDDEPAPPPKKAKAAAPAPVDDDGEDDAPPPPKKAKAAAPAPADDDDDDDGEDDAPPPPPKKGKAKAPDMAEVKARVPERKKVAPVDDDEEPAPAAKPAKGKKDNGLADLVGEWDD